jgi:N-ethylmaleimide reductase
LNAPLNEPVADTFYGSGPRGYTDYPSLDLEEQAA